MKFEMSGDYGFIAMLRLLFGPRNEITYTKEVYINRHDCDCERLYEFDCKNGLTPIAIIWTGGNKKIWQTIIPVCIGKSLEYPK